MSMQGEASSGQKVITDAEALLADIELFGLQAGFPKSIEDSVSEAARQAEMDNIDHSLDSGSDGYFDITVAADRLSATGCFYPPTAGMQPLCLGSVEKRLAELKITHGIDWKAIQEAIFTSNTVFGDTVELELAKAIQPVHDVASYLVVDPALYDKPETGDTGINTLDYKQLSPFLIVQKGAVLARAHRKTSGKPGYTIDGQELPFKRKRVRYPKPGKNTYFEDACLKAACKGRLLLDELSISVNEVLTVEEHVDYSTGHIDFRGDIVIPGEIKQGFQVNSGGSIFCAQMIDASLVVAAGDVITQQGILGRKTGCVKAGGIIQARFLENCSVEAAGSVRIFASCLNSFIQTLDKLQLGPRGMVSGGKVFTRNGMSAAQIGSASGPKTEIICGIDYVIQQKLAWIRDKNIALVASLAELKKRAPATGLSPESLAISDKIKASIHRLNEIALSLVVALDKNDQAQVIVTGTVFPGTHIEICHVSHIVTRALTAQRFSLDKEKGCIVARALR